LLAYEVIVQVVLDKVGDEMTSMVAAPVAAWRHQSSVVATRSTTNRDPKPVVIAWQRLAGIERCPRQ
jgi:hypothetical protein